jgi:hypothetical protein
MRILAFIVALLCALPAHAQQRRSAPGDAPELTADPNEARPLTADNPPRRADIRPIARMPAPAGGTALRVYREAERHTRACTLQDPEAQQWCLINVEEFLRDYLRARAGDYQGQRNVAFMLGSTRGGMIRDHYAGIAFEPTDACAWRLVIISSNHREAGAGDIANLQTACNRLTGPERQFVLMRAEQFMNAIAQDPVRNPPRRNMPLTAR